MESTIFIERFSAFAKNYDVLLCDVWGVVHNGIAVFTQAADALARFRTDGGRVILVTNAPYPADAVQQFLDRLGVRRDAYDAITSSGDVTRSIVAARLAEGVFHLGPPRDLSIFAGLNVTFAPVESADYVVCSGLVDDKTEAPEDYRAMLAFMYRRSLVMVCANPDVFVERGDALIYCAGALADAYAALGGEVLYCGKPHAPIYEAAAPLRLNAFKEVIKEDPKVELVAVEDVAWDTAKSEQAAGQLLARSLSYELLIAFV
jgi:HAD superfamily hydrolase (TIGR01459 family)